MRIITLTFLVSLPLTVHSRRIQGLRVHNERRRTYVYEGMRSEGLPKKDHIKDWRRDSKSPTTPPTISTPRPTAAPTLVPTTSPTFVPTPSPTLEPQTSTTFVPTASPSNRDSFSYLGLLLNTDVNGIQIDILDDGYSPGDVFVFEESNIFSSELGDFVGTTTGRCIVLEEYIENEDENRYCIMEFNFEDGSVKLQGILFELFVVGGTGFYEGIQGALLLTSLSPSRAGFQFFPGDGSDLCSVPESRFSGPWIEEAGNAYVDWDNNLNSPGDVFVFDNNIFRTAAQTEGITEGECMVLQDIESDKTFCTMTFLTGPDFTDIIMAQGVFDNMIVTAGFGCFAGVSGSISGRTIAGGDFQYDLAFDDDNSSNDLSCPSSNFFDQPWTEPFGDILVTYDESTDFAPGNGFVFDNKLITARATGETGILAGRIIFSDKGAYPHGSMVFTFDAGQIAVQGPFSREMTIVGGNGCFRGLQGTVQGDEFDDGFEYTWSITS